MRTVQRRSPYAEYMSVTPRRHSRQRDAPAQYARASKVRQRPPPQPQRTSVITHMSCATPRYRRRRMKSSASRCATRRRVSPKSAPIQGAVCSRNDRPGGGGSCAGSIQRTRALRTRERGERRRRRYRYGYKKGALATATIRRRAARRRENSAKYGTIITYNNVRAVNVAATPAARARDAMSLLSRRAMYTCSDMPPAQ